ncbi:hypothetical protein [Lagierella sp.]|uniref:hypothetical protein n=1 Tax=Lagierella sp. TaxID=2849657 RepID=UPI002618EAC1|nr:hypothetical protein [Lagierella sp.]
MENEFKTPKYQREASQRWREKNKARNKYVNSRSSARSFARYHAKNMDDIKELEEIFKKENPNFNKKTENND